MSAELPTGLLLDVALSIATAAEERLDDVLEGALERIGSTAAIDRAYVISFDERAGRFSNTHEWCADGVDSHRAEIQNLPTEAFRWAVEQLRRGEVVRWGEGGEVPPEAISEIESFRRYGIRSVLEVPVLAGGELLADLGFNSRRDRRWSDQEVTALERVAEALAVRLSLRREVRGMEADRRRLTERLETIGHDLRTPLQRVILAAEAAESGRALPSQAVVALLQGTSELRRAVETLLGADGLEPGAEAPVVEAGVVVEELARLVGAEVVEGHEGRPLRFRGDTEPVVELFRRMAAQVGHAGGRLAVNARPPARIRIRWELPEGVDVDDVAAPEIVSAGQALEAIGGHLSFGAGEPVTAVVDLDAVRRELVALDGLGPEEAVLLQAVLGRQLDAEVVTGVGSEDPDVLVATAEVLSAHPASGRERVLVGEGEAPRVAARTGRPVPPSELVGTVRSLLAPR